MGLIGSLPAFAVAVLLISASPGPAMALIFRRAAVRGPAAAVPTVLGLELGLYLWALFAAAFMIAFYPQFVPPERDLFATTALLAALQVVIETACYLTLVVVVGRAGAWFRKPVIRRRLDGVTGTVLVALGIRLATQAR